MTEREIHKNRGEKKKQRKRFVELLFSGEFRKKYWKMSVKADNIVT